MGNVEIRPMTDEQRKQIVIEFFKRLDSHGDVLALFADDAQWLFPKWGCAEGKKEMLQFLQDLGPLMGWIKHDYASINFIIQGDLVCAEGLSKGAMADGTEFEVGERPGGGRWCDVFEIRDFKIQRLYVYLDPDYWGKNTEPYPWLRTEPKLKGSGVPRPPKH